MRAAAKLRLRRLRLRPKRRFTLRLSLWPTEGEAMAEDIVRPFFLAKAIVKAKLRARPSRGS